MKTFDKLYIDGAWVSPDGKDFLEVINSSTEAVMGKIPAGSAVDADRAVTVASRAFKTWSLTSPGERRQYLVKLADALTARQDELGEIMAGEVGMPISMAKVIQAGLPIVSLRNYAKLLEDYPFVEVIGNSEVVKEPIGVVACITPWNFPLHQAMAKVGAALAAGCTVVLKPSEVAPLNAFIFAEVVDQIGLPAGVFNLVSGVGAVVGEALASHPKVDMVSFTGSTRAGKRVAELAAATVKKVALELGGKSASIVLNDADFAEAVKGSVNSCYFNSGQTCAAHTRLLVPESRYEEAARIAVQTAESFSCGDAMDPKMKLGPVISEIQRERVRGYIKKGIEEGAELLTGGPDAPATLPRGYFVQPTVFGRVDPHSTIAQEEIFGPVLSIITYRDEAEAIDIANDSPYGLSSGIWSKDVDHAKQLARQLRTGQVIINGGEFNMMAPFGGFKQSGSGREHGRYGLEEYLQAKNLQL
ncbi:MAG: aldehyde dehydrogenase family protein [Porticoccaceae bacterium]